MGDSSYVQTSFLGGEWSPLAQGRMDLPAYRTALNVCLNGIPMEEAAWNRRSGTRFCGITRLGNPAQLRGFDVAEAQPYQMEFSDGHLRFWNGPNLVTGTDVHTVTNISTANPAIVTLDVVPSWSNGDQCILLFNQANGNQATADCAILRNRQFVITFVVGQPNQITLADPLTGIAVNGAQVNFDATQVSVKIARVTDIVSPYTNQTWKTLRAIQAETQSILLQGTIQPYIVTITPAPNATSFASFTLNPASFIDGPYLDPVAGSQLTPSALTGVITVTIGYQTWSNTVAYSQGEFVTFGGQAYVSLIGGNLNNTPSSSPTDWQIQNSGGAVGPNGFQSTDVGRLMRIFSEPLPWAVGTAYVPGNAVSFNGAYYSALTNSTGLEPDLNLTAWQIAPNAALWTWGIIQSILAPNSVTVEIVGANLLYTTTVFTWRIGAYSNTTGWPTCGCFHKGRLWLGGAIPNRFDGSVADGNIVDFTPTAIDGTVGDANAVSGTFNAENSNNIVWIKPTSQGILAGTQAAEWLIHASALNDPITPTSIDADRVTKYGCAFVEPLTVGFTTLFVQKQQRKILEMLADVFSGRFSAPNLSRNSKHLTTAGIAELAYQEELAPIVWARDTVGNLFGCTYRRVSAFASEDPVFMGWHRHSLGSGRLVESLQSGPSVGGITDNLMMVTNDPATNVRHVEILTDLFDANAPITSSWFVDDAVTPSGCQVLTINNKLGVQFYGLWHLNGKTVSVSVGGLDCGDFLCTNGAVFVPFGSDSSGLFTQAYLTALETANVTYPFATLINTVVTTTPPQVSTPLTIRGYTFPTNIVSGVTGGVMTFDYNNNLGYVYTTNGTQGIQKFNLTTGAVLGTYTGLVGGPAWTLDGTAIAVQTGGSGTEIIQKINTSNMTLNSTFGVGANQPLRSSPQGLRATGGMCAVFAGANFLCGSENGTGGNCDFGVMNLDTMAYAGHRQFFSNTSTLIMCAGHQGNDYGEVFGLGVHVGSGSLDLVQTIISNSGPTVGVGPVVNPTTLLPLKQCSRAKDYPAATNWSNAVSYNIGDIVFVSGVLAANIWEFYFQSTQNGNLNNATPAAQSSNTFWAFCGASVATPASPLPIVQYDSLDNGTLGNPFITTNVVASIPATAFDPGATGVNRSNMVLDQQDGNLIAAVVTTGASSNSWLVKLRSSDGAILWKIKTTGQATVGVNNGSRVVGNVFGYLDGLNGLMHVINTQNGNDNPFSVPNIQPTGAEYFDAVGGRLILYNSTVQWVSVTPGTIFFGQTFANQSGSIPAVIGFTYPSQGQLLRAPTPQEGGTINGPPFGKLKRQHWYAAQVEAGVTGTISIGTLFGKLFPINFLNITIPLTAIQLFSGIQRDTLDSDYSLDSQICWQITRPVPAQIAALGGFAHGADL